MNDTIVCEDLTRALLGRPVLRELSLSVRAGETLALLGPNGAGKTTLIRHILGLFTPDSGSVRVLGQDPARDRGDLRRRIGVVFENDMLYPEASALDNVSYWARLYSVPAGEAKQRATEILERVGLEDRMNDPVRSLSRGMKRRVALARALVHRPTILLLDEPTSGLDIENRFTFREMVAEHRSSNPEATVLMASHELHEVERTCDRVAIIRDGRVTALQPTEGLTERDIERLYLESAAHASHPLPCTD